MSMNTKRYINRFFFTVVLVCFTSLPLNAQEDFGDDTNDNTPAASIDFYTPLLLISAIGLGYFLLHKRIRTKE